MRHPAHHTRAIARAICVLALLTGLSFWGKLASRGSSEERRQRSLSVAENAAPLFPVEGRSGSSLLPELFSFFLELYR
jgi:hypothetical protein